MPELYRQCRMWQKTATGRRLYVAYLPNEFAVEGNVVSLLFDGVWEDGWEIEMVGPARERALVDAFVANARKGFPSTEKDRE
jgi:hypothetical protein